MTMTSAKTPILYAEGFQYGYNCQTGLVEVTDPNDHHVSQVINLHSGNFASTVAQLVAQLQNQIPARQD